MMSSWWKGYEDGMSSTVANPYASFSWDWFVYEMGRGQGCRVLAGILEGIMKHDEAIEKTS